MRWYMFPLIGAAFVYVSTTPFFKAEQRLAEIEAALKAGPPAAVQLNAYRRPNAKFAEATILAQVVTDETRLSRRSAGGKVRSRTDYTMLILAEPAATDMPNLIKGLIILEKSEASGLANYMAQNRVADGPLGPVVSINGEISTIDPSGKAKGALAERKLGITSDLIIVKPFLGGREAYLSAAYSDTRGARTKVLLAGIAVALMGAVKLCFERAMRSRRSPVIET